MRRATKEDTQSMPLYFADLLPNAVSATDTHAWPTEGKTMSSQRPEITDSLVTVRNVKQEMVRSVESKPWRHE